MATEDLRFYEGTSWQSLSALAAEQVDAELPISSADDTVVLDSPSANTFTVSTGGVDNRLAVNARGMVGIGNAGNNYTCLYVNSVPTNATGLSGITSIPEIITADADEVSAVKTQANLGAAVAATQFTHFITGTSSGTGTAATMYGVRVIDTSLTGTAKNAAFATNLPADGEKNFSGETGSAPSTFNGDIRASKVVGTAFSTDASIIFRQQATIYALYSTPLVISTNQKESFINYTNNNSKSWFSGISTNEQFVIESSDNTDASIALGAELLTSNHTPTQPNSIATKGYADTKAELWTGTQAEYDALGIYNNQTLYCITD